MIGCSHVYMYKGIKKIYVEYSNSLTFRVVYQNAWRHNREEVHTLSCTTCMSYAPPKKICIWVRGNNSLPKMKKKKKKKKKTKWIQPIIQLHVNILNFYTIMQFILGATAVCVSIYSLMAVGIRRKLVNAPHLMVTR